MSQNQQTQVTQPSQPQQSGTQSQATHAGAPASAPQATPAPASTSGSGSHTVSGVAKDSKSTEPELVIDTSNKPPSGTSGMWSSGMGMGMGIGAGHGHPMAIFAAGPMLGMGGIGIGDFHDATWTPPGAPPAADHDFKRPSNNGPGVIGGPVRQPPQRPGSRRFNDAYGDDVTGFDPRRTVQGTVAGSAQASQASQAAGSSQGANGVSGGAPGGVPSNVVHPHTAWGGDYASSDDGGSDGGDGGDGAGGGDSFDLSPQQAAMIAAYGDLRQKSSAEKAELWDQLNNAQDIRELNVDILRSFILNGRRKLSIDDHEDITHCLLAIIETTLDRLAENEGRIQPPHGQPQPQGQPQGRPAPVQPQAQPNLPTQASSQQNHSNQSTQAPPSQQPSQPPQPPQNQQQPLRMPPPMNRPNGSNGANGANGTYSSGYTQHQQQHRQRR